MRVLGAGDNRSPAEISETLDKGTVKNAGFQLSASIMDTNSTLTLGGVVKFLGAEHSLSSQEMVAYPIFTDNASFPRSATNEADGITADGPRTNLRIIRAMLMTTTGSNFQLLNITSSLNETRVSGLSKSVRTGGVGTMRFAGGEAAG